MKLGHSPWIEIQFHEYPQASLESPLVEPRSPTWTRECFSRGSRIPEEFDTAACASTCPLRIYQLALALPWRNWRTTLNHWQRKRTPPGCGPQKPQVAAFWRRFALLIVIFSATNLPASAQSAPCARVTKPNPLAPLQQPFKPKDPSSASRLTPLKSQMLDAPMTQSHPGKVSAGSSPTRPARRLWREDFSSLPSERLLIGHQSMGHTGEALPIAMECAWLASLREMPLKRGSAVSSTRILAIFACRAGPWRLASETW